MAEDDDTEEAATAAAVMTEVETATLPGAWTGIATWTG